MVFSSTIFLFLFLPLTLALYVLVGRAARNTLLLVASLVFYAWGEQGYVLIMLGSIISNYLLGLWISATPGARRQLAVAVAITANLMLLIAFKYANFLADNLNHLLIRVNVAPIRLSPVHLPIGISFFTFQAMSYVIDVYRRVTPAQRNPLHLGLYISLFPQLIAGPIVRYHDVARQIVSRRVTLDGFTDGVQRFIIGLAKKVLIANTVALTADRIFSLPAAQLDARLAWLGLICYTLQIYFDFSGYSDMAIGLGHMFGFRFLENFNYPYISRSIREFWRRWHISLSTWFRDYLYIPLGGNRKGSRRTYLNLLIVFVLTGLWHGASWNFLLWGLLHGFFLALERTAFGRGLRKLPVLVQCTYTLSIVMLAWVFFRLGNLTQAIDYLAALFGLGDGRADALAFYIDPELKLALIAGIIGATPVPRNVIRRWLAIITRTRGRIICAGVGTLQIGAYSAAFILSVMYVAAGSYNPFIYFRF